MNKYMVVYCRKTEPTAEMALKNYDKFNKYNSAYVAVEVCKAYKKRGYKVKIFKINLTEMLDRQ